MVSSETVCEDICARLIRINSRRELHEWLVYEKKRYKIGNFIIAYVAALFGVSERCIIWRIQRRLRICEYHINAGNRIRGKISLALYHRLTFHYGIRIPPNTCGKGLLMLHLGDILINDGARIGEKLQFAY